MAENIRCLVSVMKIWRVSGLAGSHYLSVIVYDVCWVDILLFLVWYWCPIDVAWLLCKCVWNAYAVRSDRDWKYTFLISGIQVYWTRLKADVWRNLIRSGEFVVWPSLFTCLLGSIWISPPCTFIVNGDIPKSSLVVSPYYHDTTSLTCYGNCMFIKYFFILHA